MIVVDTSALIALLEAEHDATLIATVLETGHGFIIGAPTQFELMMVAHGRKGKAGRDIVGDLLKDYAIEVVAWSPDMAGKALDAFLQYGKGQGTDAKLNFGDCMSYALAKALDAPLLYKGDDFAQTDIRSALP